MNQTAADTSSVLETAANTMASVTSELSATIDSAAELARAAGRLADSRVRDRPWQAALVAGGVGLILGLCLGRR